MKVIKKTNKKTLKDYLRVEYSETKMFGLIVCVSAAIGLELAKIFYYLIR